jgi:hypothetical protein
VGAIETNWTDIDEVVTWFAARWERHGFARAGKRGRSLWRLRGEGIIAQIQFQRSAWSGSDELTFYVNLQVCSDALSRFPDDRGRVPTRWGPRGSVWSDRVCRLAHRHRGEIVTDWTLRSEMTDGDVLEVLERIDELFVSLALPVFDRLTNERDCQREWAAADGAMQLYTAVVMTDFEDEESVSLARMAYVKLERILAAKPYPGLRETLDRVRGIGKRLGVGG